MEQAEDRVKFSELFRKSYNRPVRDPDTGENTTAGKLLQKRHGQIETLWAKVLKKAEDM